MAEYRFCHFDCLWPVIARHLECGNSSPAIRYQTLTAAAARLPPNSGANPDVWNNEQVEDEHLR